MTTPEHIDAIIQSLPEFIASSNAEAVEEYINHLQEENQRLRDALEFYANPMEYRDDPWSGGTFTCTSYVQQDGGKKARQALRKEGKP